MARLREVLDGRRATEPELRRLSEEADGWARALQGQVEATERRLSELTADPASSLTEIATELRRVDGLLPELAELRITLSRLEERARELRTEWLLQHTRVRSAATRS